MKKIINKMYIQNIVRGRGIGVVDSDIDYINIDRPKSTSSKKYETAHAKEMCELQASMKGAKKVEWFDNFCIVTTAKVEKTFNVKKSTYENYLNSLA